jgi:formate-dependent nitrite reductase membrane component NrfD
MIDAPSSTWFTVSPHWRWLILVYFLLAAIAGGSYFLAAVIDLFGRREDRPLARLGYYISLPLIMVIGVVLIVDLSRPDRFWHMLLESHTFLPIYKPWSPMSSGSWVLLAFGFFALLAFVGALADAGRVRWRGAHRLRPPGLLGIIVAAVGGLFGLYMAGYAGVLLAVTNRPIWSDTTLLGMLFVASAVGMSAALMALLAGGRQQWTAPGVQSLHRLYLWLIVLQLVVLAIVLVMLGPVARAWLSLWGLLLAAVVLFGMAAPLALHGRREWFGGRSLQLAAVLVLAGGVLLRLVVLFTPDAVTS